MRMMLEDDGHTGIFHSNSLESMDKVNANALKAGAKDIGFNSIDVILTNPPFGKKGIVNDKEILSLYDLGKKNSTVLDEQVPDVLFIERCHQFLKVKDRMAIVLPDGILSGPKMQYVRDFIFAKFKVVSIVSLPYETFIPHGANVKASILFLQKLSDNRILELNKKRL